MKEKEFTPDIEMEEAKESSTAPAYDNLQLGQMHRVGDDKEEKERPKASFNSEIDERNHDDFDDLDDFEQEEELDNWLNDEYMDEDLGTDPMLRNMWQNQQRYNGLDHGFGGRDDDGFRGLDSEDGFGTPRASGFDFDGFDMESDKDFMLNTDFDVEMEI